MNMTRWLKLMGELGLEDNKEVFLALANAYSERHRFYHTAEHVDACLVEFDAVQEFAENPIGIEVALWFHDVVYKPYSSSNELDSANWAVDFLRENLMDESIISHVYELIMATCHTSLDNFGDEALIVDIDLTILGVESEKYDHFEADIRREYKSVPKFIYRKKRKAILQSFLERDTIYQMPVFRERLEEQARNNLIRAIALL